MFLEHQILILVISEGSCDSEDWSDDDKFSFDHRNKLHFTLYWHQKQIIYITKIFYCIFDQI